MIGSNTVIVVEGLAAQKYLHFAISLEFRISVILAIFQNISYFDHITQIKKCN
jgi:hypothetical protein